MASALHSQKEERAWKPRTWAQDEDPFCLPSLPQELPSGSRTPVYLQKTHQAQTPEKPAHPQGNHYPLGSATEAFPGVVSDHQLPREGPQVTCLSVQSGHAEPSKDNPHPHPTPRGFGNCNQDSRLLPWTRDSSGRMNL